MTITRKRPAAHDRPVVLFQMSTAEFAALPLSERKLELLNGKVVMAARPRLSHQKAIGDLYNLLKNWAEPRGLGLVWPEIELRLAEGWSPSPDVSFLSTAHADRNRGTHIQGPADLCVEILSPSNPETDLDDKYVAYAKHGVPWYWVIDLDATIVGEYQLVGTEYGNAVEQSFAKPFRPRLFPRLKLDLGTLAR